jgi:hypothetical protein
VQRYSIINFCIAKYREFRSDGGYFACCFLGLDGESERGLYLPDVLLVQLRGLFSVQGIVPLEFFICTCLLFSMYTVVFLKP